MRSLGAVARGMVTCCPAGFVPLRHGWEERCPLVARERRASFRQRVEAAAAARP